MGLSSAAFKRGARVGHSFAASAAGLLMSLMAVAAPGSAAAQGIPQDMKDALQRKYDILQQQAETERMRAETERTRSAGERSSKGQTISRAGNPSATSQQYAVAIDMDSLAGVYAPTYKLGNGVILQVSGVFWPDAPTVCIAHCPVTD